MSRRAPGTFRPPSRELGQLGVGLGAQPRSADRLGQVDRSERDDQFSCSGFVRVMSHALG